MSDLTPYRFASLSNEAETVAEAVTRLREGLFKAAGDARSSAARRTMRMAERASMDAYDCLKRAEQILDPDRARSSDTQQGGGDDAS